MCTPQTLEELAPGHTSVAAGRKVAGVALMTALLQVRDLMVAYRSRNRGTLTATAGSFTGFIEAMTLALIGESGSGKSSVARAICGLTPVTSGEIQDR